MINWQIENDDSFVSAWIRNEGGCSFPDSDRQEFLLPYSDVGETPIDEYGGVSFDVADLRRLQAHLRKWSGIFEVKPESWTLTESFHGQPKTIMLQREKILEVIKTTLKMIDWVLNRGGTIRFFGD